MPVNKRIVDLTRRLVPGEEPFTCDVRTFFVEELLPQFHRRPDDWYILQEWKLSSHVGTHVESPYHHLREGTNVAGLDLGTLMGDAVVLDFTGRKPDEEIKAGDFAALDMEIRPGDIVLVHTGYDRDYGKADYGRPYLSADLVDFFVRLPVSCLGIDASGIEKYRAESQPSHLKLFSAGIPIIEELTNLGSVPPGRFTFIGLPLRIEGADASPIRAIALVEEE
jgi:arylformamidase